MNLSFQTYWRAVAGGNRTRPVDYLLLLFLTPLSWLYSLALRLRAALYHYGILKTKHLPRPVVSIGNITVGGTGKTPVTAHIARFLLAQHYRVAVLSRGYGGSREGQTCIVSDGNSILLTAEECGDEPYLLATTLPGLMVIIGPDRYKAGQLALQQLSVDIFLLDDGFQHLRLHRDLNILLQDFSRPFGNGLTLPAGILREPSSAAARADLVIFTRSPKGATVPVDTAPVPACISSHTLIDLLPADERSAPLPFSHYSGHKVLAFAGIADPDSFFTGLRAEGLNLVRCLNFPDHVVYNQERCREIVETLQSSGAEILVTTEKDGVKLKGVLQEYSSRILLARLGLTFDNPGVLEEQLTTLIAANNLSKSAPP